MDHQHDALSWMLDGNPDVSRNEMMEAYHTIPEFKAAVDQLCQMLPHMVAGMLPSARKAARDRQIAVDMMRSSVNVRLI